MAASAYGALALDGEVALVTGGGSGIGAATSRLLSARGAAVAVADLAVSSAQDVAEAIAADGGRAVAVALDVRDEASVAHCFTQIESRFGRIDIAVNAAGIAGPNQRLEDIAVDAFDRVVGVNLRGVWLCMREEMMRMRAAGGGRIVNVASILAVKALENSAAYVAAKHGLLGLTRVAALEAAAAGIRVNAVCPGVIETPMTAPPAFAEDQLAALSKLHPLGRLGDAGEVAESIAWLCSRGASFTTGAALLVDGGWHAR